jgi:hypothetical protein
MTWVVTCEAPPLHPQRTGDSGGSTPDSKWGHRRKSSRDLGNGRLGVDGYGLFLWTSASASTGWILLKPKVELPRKNKARGCV